MSSNDNTVEKKTFHNFKNEWKWTVEIKMNAKGELYFTKVKGSSDDTFGMAAQSFALMKDYIQMGVEEGYVWAKGLGTQGVAKEAGESDID